MTTNPQDISQNYEYSNICINKIPRFYDASELTELNDYPVVGGKNCFKECNQNASCDMFIIKENIVTKPDDLYQTINQSETFPCKLYNITSDDVFKYNCNSKIIDSRDNSYSGIGYVKSIFFNKNKKAFKDNFHHIDYLYDKFNKISGKSGDYGLSDISNLIGELTITPNSARLRSDLSRVYENIQKPIDKIKTFLSLDKKNFLYTFLVSVGDENAPKTTGIDFAGKSNLAYDEILDNFLKIKNVDKKNSINLKNNDLRKNSIYLIYTIILLITLLSILILIIYKFMPDVISNFKLFIYFIGISFILLFIHHYTNIYNI